MTERSTYPLLGAIQAMNLLEAMERPGCPLCRCVWKSEHQNQNWYVNDGAVDERTLERVKRALGFCGWHTITLTLLEGDAFLWSHLGTTLLYEHLLHYRMLSALQRAASASSRQAASSALWRLALLRLRWELAPRERCPACRDDARAEEEQVAAFAEAWAFHAPLRTHYAASAGLCLPHLVAVKERLWNMKSLEAPAVILPVLFLPIQRQILRLSERLNPPANPEDLDAAMRVLFGAKTALWAEQRSRLHLERPQMRLRCPACSAVDAQMRNELETLLAQPTLPPLCAWHGWLCCQSSFSEHPDLTALVSRTLAARLDALGEGAASSAASTAPASSPCAICSWLQRQEAAIVQEWWQQWCTTQASPTTARVCLPHGRLLLKQCTTPDAFRDVTSTIQSNAEQLAGRLAGYAEHCSESEQGNMLPQEREVWQESTWWFGGLPAAEALLELAEPTSTDGKEQARVERGRR
jgi:hypothetical protein